MTAPIYNTIGHHYRAHRAADRRIVNQIIALMAVPRGSVVCDVGAGAGNYANALADEGFDVLALEPSHIMRAQADAHERVRWVEGVAERMPLPDGCADALICVLAIHHFTSLPETAAEMQRICPAGPLVWFTIDPRESVPFWFPDYFSEITGEAYELFPPVAEVIAAVDAVTGRRGEAHAFPLPHDLTDRFMQATWNAPEAYFDASLRANHSGFAKADQTVVERSLAKLREDLDSGVWDARHGHLRTQQTLDAGYRFLVWRDAPRRRLDP